MILNVFLDQNYSMILCSVIFDTLIWSQSALIKVLLCSWISKFVLALMTVGRSSWKTWWLHSAVLCWVLGLAHPSPWSYRSGGEINLLHVFVSHQGDDNLSKLHPMLIIGNQITIINSYEKLPSRSQCCFEFGFKSLL